MNGPEEGQEGTQVRDGTVADFQSHRASLLAENVDLACSGTGEPEQAFEQGTSGGPRPQARCPGGDSRPGRRVDTSVCGPQE